jgi:hypothetical protein
LKGIKILPLILRAWAIMTDFMQDFFQPFKCYQPKSWYIL